MPIESDAKKSGADCGPSVEKKLCEQIVIGVHGVGSPATGTMVRNITLGYTYAHLNAELEQYSSTISLGTGPDEHVYHGIRISRARKSVQVWELNWSDLKGLPDGVVGTALYALKAIIAAIQISYKGWNTKSLGATGPLFFGFALRAYFCIFVLVAPINLLLVGYAYVQSNAPLAFVLVIVLAALVSAVLIWLAGIDRLVGFSLLFLFAGVFAALSLLIIDPSMKLQLIKYLLRFAGSIEGLLGLIVFFALAELLVRFFLAKKNAVNEGITIFVTRAGIIILAVTFGAAVYGAFVHAAGFYALNNLTKWGMVDEQTVKSFGVLYLEHVGYNVAQMELINWATTFAVGAFLLSGMVFQLLAINLSSDWNPQPRGLRMRNWFNAFLWLTIIGFLFVFFTAIADQFGFFESTDRTCVRAWCSIYGIQWLLQFIHYDTTQPLSPLEIYAASATRIFPFIPMIIVPSLRAGLNVAADVLLYILPARFPLSLETRVKERFRGLLNHLRDQHPAAKISIVAHSQGTVIVRDVLSEATVTNIRLVTAGSPLSSLYDRFLGRSVKALPGCDWTNIYRLSDYIGGPLSNPNISDEILKRNYRFAHFFYFEDPAVITAALR